MSSKTPKYRLNEKVIVESFRASVNRVPRGEPLCIYQTSCGEGRSEVHYWARDSRGKSYEFEESDIKRVARPDEEKKA